ncbi:MAG: hypothetical protein ACU0A9_10405 [Alterinioella nitratireducens]|uniref:hypothetical protein n=1 Tax=Alterinioella nitratireducens TaxID=2735915 RepID=UPI0040588AEB
MEWWGLFRDWTNAHSGIIAFFALVLSLLFAVLIGARARAGIPSLGDILKDRASWPRLTQRWRRGWGQAYFDAIAEVQQFAVAFYGPKALSFRAFDRCLTLALLYPILAVLLGWVVANAYDPGGLALFPDEPRFLVRIGKAMALIGAWGICFWILKNAEKFADFFVDRLLGPLDTAPARTGFLAKAVRAGFELLAVAVAGAFAVAGAGAVAFAVAVAVVVVVAVAVAVGNQEAAALILLLYLALPILNAVADWLSIAITRRFLAPLAEAATDAAKRPSLPLILMQSAFDLVLALICLAGLLAAIVLALAVWDRVSPGTLPFTWQAYWAEIASNPLRGIPLYLMIATTLLPTVVHLIAGFGAMFTYRRQALEREADILEDKLNTGAALTEIERGDMVRRVRRVKAAGFGLALFCCAALFLLIVWPVLQVAF